MRAPQGNTGMIRTICISGRLAVAAAFFAMVGIWPAAAQDQPPALVHVDAVISEPMSQTAPVVGRIVAREAVIATQVASAVFRIHADIGDRIERGDLLAELDPSRLQSDADLRKAERDEAEANLEASAASLAVADQALERLRSLRSSAAFSQARFDEAELELRRNHGLVAVAQARLARAEANWARSLIDLEDAQIRAPFSGVVGDRSAHVGEYLRVGDPVMMVINESGLEVEALVPLDRLAGIHPGAELTVVLDDGTRHSAAVRASVPMENSQTRTRIVRLTPDFSETVNPLAGNQSAIVLIPIGEARNVVTVHKDAILNQPNGSVVFVVEEGQAMMRPIRLGESVGSRFAVIEGLAPGDLVVVRGNERLRPGQLVRHNGAS